MKITTKKEWPTVDKQPGIRTYAQFDFYIDPSDGFVTIYDDKGDSVTFLDTDDSKKLYELLKVMWG